MRDRNKAVPAVYLVLRKENELLLMRRQGSGYYDGWYSVMGGHVEAGELPRDALVREAREELGITLEKKDLELVHTMYRTKHDPTGDRSDYFFSAETWRGEPAVHEPKKCDEIRWFPLLALPEKLMHHVRTAIEHIKEGVAFSELGLDDITRNPSG